MDGPEKLRPAQELTSSPDRVTGHYLQYLRAREGRLCTFEELTTSHQKLMRMNEIRPTYLREIILRIRKGYLREGEVVVTLLSHAQRGHGFYYLSDGREEIGSLSELDISLFEDGLEGGLVVPDLSVLTRKINQNSLIRPSNLLPLFDKLLPKDSQNRQRPYLTLPERRTMVLLAEHPEGVEAETLLKQALEVDFPDLARERYVIENHLLALRRKIKGVFRIYRLPFPRKPGEKRKFGEARFFLLGEEKVGEEIQIPPEEREIFSSLPGPVRGMVEELCSRFIVGEKLSHSLNTFERRLLYFLASRFGYPCSMQELVEAVNPSKDHYQDPSIILTAAKRKIQRALKGTEFGIITISRCYEARRLSFPAGAYVFGYRALFQEEKMEIPIYSGEFDNINTRIRQRIRKMCQLTMAVRNEKGELVSRKTVVPPRERRVLLALAKSFPEGCSFQSLASCLPHDAETNHFRNLIVNRISEIKKKIKKEFTDLGISIKYDKKGDQYRLEVQK
jgi:hypothetical protein